MPDVSALEFVGEVIAVELTLQRDLPRSLPFKRCYPAQYARLDDLLRVLCVLPGNVLTQLELRSDGFDDQVVVSTPNVPWLILLPLDSFFVWM